MKSNQLEVEDNMIRIITFLESSSKGKIDEAERYLYITMYMHLEEREEHAHVCTHLSTELCTWPGSLTQTTPMAVKVSESRQRGDHGIVAGIGSGLPCMQAYVLH